MLIASARPLAALDGGELNNRTSGKSAARGIAARPNEPAKLVPLPCWDGAGAPGGAS